MLALVASLALTNVSCRRQQPVGQWPGQYGRSGVNGDPIINRESIEAFCTWRGRTCPIGHVYTDYRSWASLTDSQWMFDFTEGFPGQLVISLGLVPLGRAADLDDCAAGTFDGYWEHFGEVMVRNGRATSIIRLGWEFNGTFMPWSALDTDVWIGCYRHAAESIRRKNPQVLFDWTINSHGTPAEACDGRSTNCYPGDDVVDIIGIDNYDNGPSVGSKAEFDALAAQPEGLTWLLEFAKRHNKPFSVGEWGVAPGSPYNTHGENPEFIRWMNQWFAANAPHIAYEAYFTNCLDGVFNSNLYLPVGPNCHRRNDAAGAIYRELWGT
jgi:hypothetical protein